MQDTRDRQTANNMDNFVYWAAYDDGYWKCMCDMHESLFRNDRPFNTNITRSGKKLMQYMKVFLEKAIDDLSFRNAFMESGGLLDIVIKTDEKGNITDLKRIRTVITEVEE